MFGMVYTALLLSKSGSALAINYHQNHHKQKTQILSYLNLIQISTEIQLQYFSFQSLVHTLITLQFYSQRTCNYFQQN